MPIRCRQTTRPTSVRLARSCGAALAALSIAWPGCAPATAQRTAADSAHVLVVYHSVTGHTRRMAEEVAAGARAVDGVRVTLAATDAIAPDALTAFDAIVVGSPTHWANPTVEIKRFIDAWPYLGDRIGGAFATGGGDTGGKEHVVVSVLLAMLNHGMIVAGPLYDDGGFRYGTYGASAATGAGPPGERELDDARRLGERVARLALRQRTG